MRTQLACLILLGMPLGTLPDDVSPEERQRIEEESCFSGHFPPWLDDAALRQAKESDKLARSLTRGVSRLAKPPSQAHDLQVRRSAFQRYCAELKRARKGQGQPAKARASTSSSSIVGCAKDTDCKGDRICEGGICSQPPVRQVEAAAPTQ